MFTDDFLFLTIAPLIQLSSVFAAVILVCDRRRAAILCHDGQGHVSRIVRLLSQGLQPGTHFQLTSESLTRTLRFVAT